MRAFRARFAGGDCPLCEKPVRKGQQIVKGAPLDGGTGEVYQHLSCAPGARRAGRGADFRTVRANSAGPADYRRCKRLCGASSSAGGARRSLGLAGRYGARKGAPVYDVAISGGMALTVIEAEAETETGDSPAVMIVSASELGSRSGRLLRHLCTHGAVIRIDDLRLGETVGWLSADPPEAVRGLPLPVPGTARDAV